MAPDFGQILFERSDGINMLGLKRATVELYDHEELWEETARQTIGRLKEILGDIADDIQHVGSTSIKSIKAKPIIDIAVAVKSFDAVLERKEQLQENGFILRPTELDQLLFVCGDYSQAEAFQTHFIHVVKTGGMDYINYINFRDYLNAKPEIARQYEALKMSLAEKFHHDVGRENYLAGKHDFIRYTLRKALVWSYLGKAVAVKIDRPMGYVHQKQGYTLTYPINYGYIEGVLGGDGEELDVYVLGVDKPVDEAYGTVKAIVHRENDVEDKLVAVVGEHEFTADEICEAVKFQEQYYISRIETDEQLTVRVAKA